MPEKKTPTSLTDTGVWFILHIKERGHSAGKENGLSRIKKDKKTKLLLARLAAVRGREREPLPRPAVFEDGKKYRRSREKQRRRRYDPEE